MAASLIQSDPSIMMGKPVVAGTRIPVELILEKLAAGETVDQLLEAHPRLTRQGIQAALGFAAQALRADSENARGGEKVRPGGALALVGAWGEFEDEEVDEMLEDIYAARRRDTRRSVVLDE